MSQQPGNLFSSANKPQEGQKQEPGSIFGKSPTGSGLGLSIKFVRFDDYIFFRWSK